MYITDKIFLHMVKSAGISVHTGLINSNQNIHWNLRHASLDCLPKKYQNQKQYPRYGVIRKPDDWYESFYRFFVNVPGYMSFMLNDPLPPDKEGKIFIKPIEFNEFVTRSINLKETLLKFPNKARVFNNILKSQGPIHFVTTYFKGSFSVDNPETLNQFDMSLYEWFYRGCGMHTSTNIPMNKLKDVETLFNISIGHENKTKNQTKLIYKPEVLELVKQTHKKFYDEFENYKGLK